MSGHPCALTLEHATPILCEVTAVAIRAALADGTLTPEDLGMETVRVTYDRWGNAIVHEPPLYRIALIPRCPACGTELP